jgi:hypothetical protein
MELHFIPIAGFNDTLDFAGKSFNSIRVRKAAPSSPSGIRRWVCECLRCGSIFVEYEYALRMKYQKDCGRCPLEATQPLRTTAADWEG